MPRLSRHRPMIATKHTQREYDKLLALIDKMDAKIARLISIREGLASQGIVLMMLIDAQQIENERG